MGKEIRFTKTSRKHKIGKAHAMSVIESENPKVIQDRDGFDKKLVWIGSDDRGLGLEIVGLDLEDMILIIHVMPVSYRRGK